MEKKQNCKTGLWIIIALAILVVGGLVGIFIKDSFFSENKKCIVDEVPNDKLLDATKKIEGEFSISQDEIDELVNFIDSELPSDKNVGSINDLDDQTKLRMVTHYAGGLYNSNDKEYRTGNELKEIANKYFGKDFELNLISFQDKNFYRYLYNKDNDRYILDENQPIGGIPYGTYKNQSIFKDFVQKGDEVYLTFYRYYSFCLTSSDVSGCEYFYYDYPEKTYNPNNDDINLTELNSLKYSYKIFTVNEVTCYLAVNPEAYALDNIDKLETWTYVYNIVDGILQLERYYKN